MPKVVIANHIPYTEPQTDPLEALDDTLVFSSDDWGATPAMAWTYGIIVGWKDPTPLEGETGDEAMDELAERFGWSPEQIERLRELHRRFDALRRHAP